MALVDNRKQRLAMLCAMYVAQGVPWGFMTIALGNYLGEQGVSDGDVGHLKAMVMWPWTLKLIWAPVIDTFRFPAMGRRRPWMIGAELMMAVSLLTILALGDLTQNLALLGWMFFTHNCFATLQDVATDALAVDILPTDEQGRTNGMMWGSKLLGRAVGAAGMAAVIAQFDLSAAVMLQFFILMIIMLFPLLLLERDGERRFPWSQGEAQETEGSESVRNPKELFKDLYTAFSLRTTSVFVFFGTINLVGWGITETIVSTLYTQKLGWAAADLSFVTGAIAIGVELFGAIAGGFLADRWGRRLVMAVGFGLYGLTHVVFGLFPELWHETWFAGGYVALSPGFLSFGSVGFLSMSMQISWTKASATVFTIFMTVNNIGHTIGNECVGWLRGDHGLSYEQTFVTAGVAMWLPLLLLLLTNPAQVQRAREVDTSGVEDTDSLD